ncbi:hypothetical protein Hanom_Chr10g00910861 [Helianthus anomalus]
MTRILIGKEEVRVDLHGSGKQQWFIRSSGIKPRACVFFFFFFFFFFFSFYFFKVLQLFSRKRQGFQA